MDWRPVLENRVPQRQLKDDEKWKDSRTRKGGGLM